MDKNNNCLINKMIIKINRIVLRIDKMVLNVDRFLLIHVVDKIIIDKAEL